MSQSRVNEEIFVRECSSKAMLFERVGNLINNKPNQKYIKSLRPYFCKILKNIHSLTMNFFDDDDSHFAYP